MRPEPVQQRTTTMRGDERPILVVGAGPTGLTLACELARHGASVRIIDRREAIASQARATGLHSRTPEVFQQMGIVEPVVAQGQRMAALNQYINGERTRRIEFAAIDSPFPYSVALKPSPDPAGGSAPDANQETWPPVRRPSHGAVNSHP
jgi:choline dehydrogenase-like flavoprotein